MKDRRSAVKLVLIGGPAAGLLSGLGNSWVKPVINTVILPAHAQTSASACSGFTNTAVNETLTVVVTATEIQGPITVSRNGITFSGESQLEDPGCRPGETLVSDITFTGRIDSSSDSIEGDLIISQTCNGDFVSEQITSFNLIQSPVSSDIEGTYTGTLSGSIRRCNDF